MAYFILQLISILFKLLKEKRGFLMQYLKDKVRNSIIKEALREFNRKDSKLEDSYCHRKME